MRSANVPSFAPPPRSAWGRGTARSAVEGAAHFDELRNSFEHTVEICVDVLVGYTDNAPASRPQIRITCAVVGALLVRDMRSSINFQDQTRRDTGEIGDERTGRVLPADPNAGAVATEIDPQQGFCMRHLTAQFSGSMEGLRFVIAHRQPCADAILYRGAVRLGQGDFMTEVCRTAPSTALRAVPLPRMRGGGAEMRA